jgi:NADPH-dependent ferric siderophore reductase
VPAPPAPPAPRRRPAPLAASVSRIEQLSPRMRRVTLAGGDLGQFTWPGAASHLKLILPLPGGDGPVMPEPDADGTVVFDRSQVTMRTYTPRAWDPEAGELVIDVFVHGDGPASVWASQAAPGDRVAVSRPRAHYDADPAAPWLVLAGDESAVPAISTILDAGGTPEATAVVIECDGDDQDLGLPNGSSPTFVRRGAVPGTALLEALAERLPPGPGRVWVAGEARGIRQIRAHLLHERQLPAEAVVTRGYWRQGEADHPDHDFGEE